MSILDAFRSLADPTNKAKEGTRDALDEGALGGALGAPGLEMPDEDLLKLVKEWKGTWETHHRVAKWAKETKESRDYWKGLQHDRPSGAGTGRRDRVDNVIFEGIETYLPMVTRRNPDPSCEPYRRDLEADPKEARRRAKGLQSDLAEIGEDDGLRLKLKRCARHWTLGMLGVLKFGWDADADRPTAKAIRPELVILDPDATVDEDGYTGRYVGERREMTVGELKGHLEVLEAKPGALKALEKEVARLSKKSGRGGTDGTKVGFIEWWTPDMWFWTMDGDVLMKRENPHWNYDAERPVDLDESGLQPTDGEGNPLTETVPGRNFLPAPGMPYAFLSVFNLGEHPMDDTSLVLQNLSTQDLVNKRLGQIDRNADGMNGGIVVSRGRAGLNAGQAAQVQRALRNGGAVEIPDGIPREAIDRMAAPSLPPDVYQQQIDARQRASDMFGTRGSSAAALMGERTVTGKMQNRTLDTDRIGGLFGEYLELMAAQAYRWFAQLLYVYDARYRDGNRIRVTVRPGSLLPKDSLSRARQAIDLAAQNRMSLKDLYAELDYANGDEMAANVWLEVNAPETLYGEDSRVTQVIDAFRQAQQGQEPERKAPSKSINYRDLDPAAKAALLEQAGLQADPNRIEESEIRKDAREMRRDMMMRSFEIDQKTRADLAKGGKAGNNAKRP